ncbi:hypothetical protein CTAYLR_001550 [Chrysophaeum taylorii]|uniref:Uncharacterized protein n=1 Tax=Chrysophaeum taylorii TaxID=2483200 RepID=A0AAD7UDB8_9STRA|nr:hypothetical protein CTAYLR_001550 [Chrysophaeum taylorii]
MPRARLVVQIFPAKDGEEAFMEARGRKLGLIGTSESLELDGVVGPEASQAGVVATIDGLVPKSQRRLVLACGPTGVEKSRTVTGLVEECAQEGGTLCAFEVFEQAVFDLLAPQGARLPGRERRHLDGLRRLPASSARLAVALARSRRRRRGKRENSHVVFAVDASGGTRSWYVDCVGDSAVLAKLASATTGGEYWQARFRDDRSKDSWAMHDLATLRRVLAAPTKEKAATAARSSTLTFVLREALLGNSTLVLLALPNDKRLAPVAMREIDLYRRRCRGRGASDDNEDASTLKTAIATPDKDTSNLRGRAASDDNEELTTLKTAIVTPPDKDTSNLRGRTASDDDEDLSTLKTAVVTPDNGTSNLRDGGDDDAWALLRSHHLGNDDAASTLSSSLASTDPREEEEEELVVEPHVLDDLVLDIATDWQLAVSAIAEPAPAVDPEPTVLEDDIFSLSCCRVGAEEVRCTQVVDVNGVMRPLTVPRGGSIEAAVEAFAAANALDRGGGCESRGCVAGRIAEAVRAECAADDEDLAASPLDRLKLIHVPKTGGTWVKEAALREDPPLNISLWRWDAEPSRVCRSPYHTPPSMFDPHGLGRGPYEGFVTFCVARHPLDRAVSQFRWELRIKEPGVRPPFDRDYTCGRESLNSWVVDRVAKYLANPFACDCHFLPQSYYVLDAANQVTCDHVLRHEHLDRDLTLLLRRLGHPAILRHPTFELKFHGPPQDACPLSPSALNATSRALLHRIYAADLDTFGYAIPRLTTNLYPVV